MCIKSEISIENILQVIDINVAKRKKYGWQIMNTLDIG